MKPMIILKWLTNVVTMVMLALVAFIVGAHFVEPEEALPVNYVLSNEEIFMVIAMGLLFLGGLIAFWYRIIGGLMSVLALFTIILVQGELEMGFVFFSFFALGISNLVLGIHKRRSLKIDEKETL